MPSYRCHYHPIDRDGLPVPCDSGVLPFVQLQATSAEQAQRAAHALIRSPIATVERLEADETTPPHWPHAPLSRLQADRIAAQRVALGMRP